MPHRVACWSTRVASMLHTARSLRYGYLYCLLRCCSAVGPKAETLSLPRTQFSPVVVEATRSCFTTSVGCESERTQYNEFNPPWAFDLPVRKCFNPVNCTLFVHYFGNSLA